MPGLQDLLKQLRQQRQQQLERYDLGSALEDIKKKLDEILKTEREGIERRVADAQRARASGARSPRRPAGQLEQMAAAAPAGARPDARGPRRAHPGPAELRVHGPRRAPHVPGADAVASSSRCCSRSMQGMQQATPEHEPRGHERMREMLRDLNQHAARAGRGRRARLPGVQGQVGPELPRRREPRPAPRADRAAGGADAVAARRACRPGSAASSRT